MTQSEPDFRDKYASMDIRELAKQLNKLTIQHEKKKLAAAAVWKEIEYLKYVLLPEKMDALGTTNMKLPGIGRVQISFQTSTKQVDKIALKQWLRDNGHEALIQESINSSTLNSFMRAQVANGEPIPDDSVVIFKSYEVASVIKG